VHQLQPHEPTPSQLAPIIGTLKRAADLAGGNQISATTIRRWTDEAIALLAARAQRQDRALAKIARRGGKVVLIDGTLIPTHCRTGADNRRNYSGKQKRHGLHFLDGAR